MNKVIRPHPHILTQVVITVVFTFKYKPAVLLLKAGVVNVFVKNSKSPVVWIHSVGGFVPYGENQDLG